LPVIEALDGALLVTADHGNADCMFEIDKKTGEPSLDTNGNARAKTSHTLNPVPLHAYVPGGKICLDAGPLGKAKPGLANLAGSILTLMGFEAPEGFEPSLVDLA